jgi:hypothetical protein
MEKSMSLKRLRLGGNQIVRIFVGTLFVASLNFSCSGSKNSKKDLPDQSEVPVLEPNPLPTATPIVPEPPKPEVPPESKPGSDGKIDYSTFRAKSFAALPWESKCEGMQSFIEDFGKKYLEQLELTSKPVLCDTNFTSDKLDFWVRASMKKDGEVLELELRVRALFDWKTNQLEVIDSGIWRVEGISSSNYQYRSKDGKFGRKLGLLPTTLAAWAKEKIASETFVFGMTYSAYADSFAKSFGMETEGVRAVSSDFKSITIKLLPNSDSPGKGSVTFQDAAPRFFVDYEDNKSNYLGCESVECLNSASIQYELLGNKLVLSGKPVAKDSCTVETEYFRYTVEKENGTGYRLRNGLWAMSASISINCGNH